jgi:hypothetical protein
MALVAVKYEIWSWCAETKDIIITEEECFEEEQTEAEKEAKVLAEKEAQKQQQLQCMLLRCNEVWED